ncbi:eukaryotic translation initiation factor 4E1-like [Scaptodrosophila lebanonensis]|uniref:Eukaryotic translation initiation factor 4E1-like n=1 Tax=Drosophila lebanonensis TaxID=7225 RepID=A0A6J2UAH2_DROLE|nr:eukaryotic translation initiation factor 4E1-like [Scaptodrosophila lebanonensis]
MSSKTVKVKQKQQRRERLKGCWTIWHIDNCVNRILEQRLTEIASFNKSQEFHDIFNALPSPLKLDVGDDYAVYRKGLTPLAIENSNSGQWELVPESNSAFNLELFWECINQMIVYEFFDHSELIGGVVIQRRSEKNSILIWLLDGRQSSSVLKIGYKLKEKAPIGCTLHYTQHEHMIWSGSAALPIYSL